jgi:aryl-alcohol dehydrogenase-like predicted oxidoreductase
MVLGMEYRRLGSSGMYVSEISYGNWITHGSQVESDAAIKCVRTAYDLGITTFDTADVYAGTKAESVLGKALKGVKRERSYCRARSSRIPQCIDYLAY